MTIITPTNARKNFYGLLKEVNENNNTIEILSEKTGNSAVLVSKSDWDSIQETLYLVHTGVADVVLQREEEGEFVPLGEVDWDML